MPDVFIYTERICIAESTALLFTYLFYYLLTYLQKEYV